MGQLMMNNKCKRDMGEQPPEGRAVIFIIRKLAP